MSAPALWEPLLVSDAILGIAQDLFATMIDGEPGTLDHWWGEAPELVDPRYTWVDVADAEIARVVIGLGRATGEEMTRALLMLDPAEPVSDADFVDAMGEVANVVCGNIKSLVTHPGTLTMPVVAETAPSLTGGDCLVDATLSWRGAPLTVSLWVLA